MKLHRFIIQTMFLLFLLFLWLGVGLQAQAQTGTVTYIYTDQQGTPLAEANASGTITATFDYTPYGSLALGTAPNGPGYTGHVNDPDTGLVYMQARYYDPATGRFLSIDPVVPAAGNTFNFNRYDYTSNNPENHIDPDGKADCGNNGVCEQNKAPIYGNGQESSKTPTHASTSIRIANQAASEADTKSVHLNQSLRTVTGDPNAPNVRPDVSVVKNNGNINQVEVRSAGQTAASLQDKMATARTGLGVDGSDIVVEPDAMPNTSIGAFGALGAFEMVLRAYSDQVKQEKADASKSESQRALDKDCHGRECT